MISLVVLPVQLKYKWKMRSPTNGRASKPTTTEQIIIMTVGSMPDYKLPRAKSITFRKKVPIVSTTDARNMMKNR